MQMTEKKRWVLFGLPFTFTTYLIEDEMLTIKEGILSRKENSCYMYKVTDVELKRSLGERIFGLGTVVCYTGDVTHPTLTLEHIKNSQTVKATLLDVSEAHRIKRRTVNMQNIGMDEINMELD